MLVAIRRGRFALIVLCGVLGTAAAVRQTKGPVIALSEDRFLIIRAPIDHDWIQRDEVFLLRVSQFAVRASPIDQPLMIYARFVPPQIETEKWIRVEGF